MRRLDGAGPDGFAVMACVLLQEDTSIDEIDLTKEVYPMARVEELLAQEFSCPRCKHRGGTVERLSMSGTGLSRLFEIQPYRYAFVSCSNCGYTEVYNLRTLEGKDDVATFLDILFAD